MTTCLALSVVSSTPINTSRLRCTSLAFVMEQTAYFYLEIRRIKPANLENHNLTLKVLDQKFPQFCIACRHAGIWTGVQSLLILF